MEYSQVETMPDLNDRLIRIESKLDSHFDEQSKKNKFLFDLMNEKVIPTVQIAKDIKDDLKAHLDHHSRGITVACSIIGAAAVALNFVISMAAKK